MPFLDAEQELCQIKLKLATRAPKAGFVHLQSMGSNQDRALLFFVCLFVCVCLRVCVCGERVSSRVEEEKDKTLPSDVCIECVMDGYGNA